MSRCKTEDDRLFYLQFAATERHSTRELERQINSSIFERTLLADATLPPAKPSHPQTLSGVFRDSYILDFLNLSPNHSENDLKTALVRYLKDFILELGRDFSFLGSVPPLLPNTKSNSSPKKFYVENSTNFMNF
jgi:predicted nuclease of restriction endonuclease-like (RecB) superfamily